MPLSGLGDGMHGLLALRIGQRAHSLLRLGTVVDIGLGNLIETDLAIDGNDEYDADNDAEQKWQPPARVPADVGEGFGRRHIGIDDAFNLAEACGPAGRLRRKSWFHHGVHGLSLAPRN